MIAGINGTLVACPAPQQAVIATASGIAYELEVTIDDHEQLLPLLGSFVALHTHLVIREEAQSLYGFIEYAKRQCFRQLIKVSGVGPKLALSLLSTFTVEELILALYEEDINKLALASGVGKKLASRLVVELKGKLTQSNTLIDQTQFASMDNQLSFNHDTTKSAAIIASNSNLTDMMNNDNKACLLPNDKSEEAHKQEASNKKLSSNTNNAAKQHSASYGNKNIATQIRNDVIGAMQHLGFADWEIVKLMKELPKDISDTALAIKFVLKLANK